MPPPRSRRIAILGATGHIAKSLTEGFLRGGRHRLLLFARSPQRAGAFLERIGLPGAAPCLGFDDFPGCDCDAVINCVGIGDPGGLRDAGADIFKLTEAFDNLALDYVTLHPDARYINVSSGAAYGGEFIEPAGEATPARFPANAIGPADGYGISKLNAEAKHRALPHLPIVDLRVFGFFSRHIPLSARFLMSEALSSIIAGRTLETGPDDIVRDYIHPADLLSLVEACLDTEPLNDVFDVRSLAPARKFDILRLLEERHGLRYILSEDAHFRSATGIKPNYFSTSSRASARLGFQPRFTSLECVGHESDAILAGHEINPTNGVHP